MNSILILFLYLFLFVLFSLTGFTIVRLINVKVWDDHLTDLSIGISGSILSSLAIFMSIILSFIIVYLWTNYNDTIRLLQKQMDDILMVYNTIKLLNNKNLNQLFIKYIYKKITFQELQKKIFENDDGSIIYKQIIKSLNNTYYSEFAERNAVSTEIWIVIYIGVIAVMVGTWFVKSPFYLHLYLIISVAGILGVLVFLIYYYNSLDCYRCIENQLRQKLIIKL